MSHAKALRRAGLSELAEASFENRFVDSLPADKDTTNVSRPVREASYTRVDPTPVRAPRLLAWSDALGETLGIARPKDPEGEAAQVLAGNQVLAAMKPHAARYGGHQFGTWAGQLGDGRAITLAELVAADGTRQELQLKGAGQTPYSRRADGRAVLRSSLREFACSEAMHHLGVPTTRALSLAATGEDVIRDMFYDGHPQPEPGAVVCRVSPSFVRFGNFQIYAATQEIELLRRFVAYVTENFFPGKSIEEMFREVCRRTALLMADWMRLGFVHGVMNTDNMSVLGLTIDYGPYGWLEGYDPMWTPNTTDAEGRRYCYGNQPHIAQWNLARFGEALIPISQDVDSLENSLALYADTFNEAWQRALAQKLGLAALGEEDQPLTSELFKLLGEEETDFTIFFRRLAAVPLDPSAPDAALVEPLRDSFYRRASPERQQRVAAWLRQYIARAQHEGVAAATRTARMNAANPKYVFRNYLAQQAIDALATGDASVLERLMRVLERPFEEQPGEEELAARRPEWARHRAGCSALSCSS
jgi:uncharacterized protein YdiU (UPF0061 family)